MIRGEAAVRIGNFSFGRITVDGITDVAIDHGKVRRRNKKPSKEFRVLRAYATVGGGRDSMEVPPARHWHRRLR
jgi:hypothetical protein